MVSKSDEARGMHKIITSKGKLPTSIGDFFHQQYLTDRVLHFIHFLAIATKEDLDAGNILDARQRVRSIANIHWDRGVVPRHMLAFQSLGRAALNR